MKTLMHHLILVATLTLFPLARSQTTETSKPTGSTQPAMTQGEIRKVDKDNGKLTIRHESIAHMSMPAMTMVFLVKDKSLLDTVKPGDKIRFVVIQDAGKMIVTEIQPSP